MKEFELLKLLGQFVVLLHLDEQWTELALQKSNIPIIKQKISQLNTHEHAQLQHFGESIKSITELEHIYTLIKQTQSKSTSISHLNLQKTPNILRQSKSLNSFNISSMDGTTLAMTPKTPRFSHLRESRKELFSSPFKSIQDPPEINISQFKTLSDDLKEQEAWIIEDLLYILMGMDGEFIKSVHSKNENGLDFVHFCIHDELDPSLRDLVKKITPLASSFKTITDFIDSHSAFQYGTVNNSLCASMRDIQKEYLVLIAQLEHQAHVDSSFTLGKLWFYVGASIHTMETLASLSKLIVSQESESEPDLTFINISNIRACLGGAKVLNILADEYESKSGDPDSKKLYKHLSDKCMVPYLDMIRDWIFKGQISDSFNEFMVVETQILSKEHLMKEFNDVYWEQRYSLSEERIPKIFEQFKDKILLSGKYLNVIKECGIAIPDRDIMYSYYEKNSEQEKSINLKNGDGIESCLYDIQVSYMFANHTLLELLMKKEDLLSKLGVLKTYFLLEQSDFLTQLFDLSIRDLVSPIKKVSKEKLATFLELVVRSGCDSKVQLFRDSIRVDFDSITLFEKLLKINSVSGLDMKKYMQDIKPSHLLQDSLGHQHGGMTGSDLRELTGIEAFTLDLKVEFPLSLVLNKKIISKYQLLFRHLFQCKYIERLLMGTWLDHSKIRQSQGGTKSKSTYNPMQDEIEFLGRMSSMSGKMLNFFQQFMYYMFSEVIEPQWGKLEINIKKARAFTVENVLSKHDDFLNTCLKECMLTNPQLLKCFNKIVNNSKAFCEFSEWYCRFKGRMNETKSTFGDDKSYMTHPVQSNESETGHVYLGGIRATPASASFTLKKIEKEFHKQMCYLIELLSMYGASETACLGNLCNMMDYNFYYSHLEPDVGYVSTPVVARVSRIDL